ncbi:DUF7287 family protein [Halobaculum gomorrense]|uniref:Uncharacterized protein n=1 Tax=Halobaculum gomorrense TaxID=43928 RepID=A0A1M5S1J2_9EURY|nr:hypothetical protein [Halobaculum gomorrense]SHH31913.1 hypothetical protein SAMN05443636_2295 [Halobaculum gomorrense]
MSVRGRVTGTRLEGDRGQTTIDYAVGVSVFLLVVAFVFAFVPSLVGPFTSDDTASVVVADRAADRLANDLLVDDPTAPSVLNETCTAAFFDADGAAPPDGCRYDTDGSDLVKALGLGSSAPSLNVTVRSGETIATVDGTTLAVGASPPPGAEVSVARRATLLAGETYSLAVRVW